MVLPNQLTILRIILTPVFMYMFLSNDSTLQQLSIIVFFIAAITDWYDGWLARKFNYITQWGKFMDPLADKILTSAAFISFVILDVLPLWMVILIIVRDFLITGLRLYADYKKYFFYTSRLAQWKTFIQLVFLYYLLVAYTLSTVEWLHRKYEELFGIFLDDQAIYYSMLAVMLFTLITGINYLIKNKNLLEQIFTVEN